MLQDMATFHSRTTGSTCIADMHPRIVRFHQHIRETSQKFDHADAAERRGWWWGWIEDVWSWSNHRRSVDAQVRALHEQANTLQSVFVRALLMRSIPPPPSPIDIPHDHEEVGSPPDKRYIEPNVVFEEDCI